MPAASLRIMPALSISRWLASSASAGVSLTVWRWNCDRRIGFIGRGTAADCAMQHRPAADGRRLRRARSGRAVGPDRGARQFELAGTLLGVEHARVAAAVLVDLDLAFALERGDVGARGRALRAFTGGGAGGAGAGDAARRGRGRRRARGGERA